MTRKTLNSAARYILLGVSVFIVGLVWNFPYEQIQERLTENLHKRTGYRLEVEALSPALPVGFRAKNVHVTGPPIAGMDVDNRFTSMRVTGTLLSPLRYLFRRQIGLSFQVDDGAKEWTGHVAYSAERLDLSLRTKGWKIAHRIPKEKLDALFSETDIRIEGTVSLDVSLTGDTAAITGGDFSNAQGSVNADAVRVELNAPVVRDLRFDSVDLRAEIKDGKAEIRALSLKGPDLEGTLHGTLAMEKYFPRSQLQLEAKVTIPEKTKALRDLVTVYGPLKGLRLTDDGILAFRISGAITPLSLIDLSGY